MIANKKYGLLLVIGAFILLCGCQKGKNEIEIESVELPRHVMENFDEKIKIDADVIFPENIQKEVDVLEIEPARLQAQEIVDKLYPNAILFNEGKGIYKDGDSYININDGNFFYDDKEQQIYGRFFTNQEELLFPKAKNLEELDMDEALEMAKQYLTVVGLENIELDEYYVLSKQFLEEKYRKAQKDESWQKDVEAGREVFKEDWQEEKGAYVFVFSVIEHNLPIVRGMYITKDNEYIEGSSITICCSEDGVAFVEAIKNYNVKALSGKKKIAGMKVILKSLEQKFSNLIIEEPIIVNKICLAYQTQKIKEKLYLVPVWEVQYFQQNEGDIEKGHIYFDVESGKEIVMY